MNKKIQIYLTITMSVLLSSAYSQPIEPTMFLCVDSMISLKEQQVKEPQKLVYGYIDGKKTSCMSEYEFRVVSSKADFDRDSSSRKNTIYSKRPFQNAVYCGEKNLANADLRGFDLKGIDLSGANLSHAQLESADLRSANLKNANLSGANLENAYCKNADFYGADLTSANLHGTFFHHANLIEAEGLSMENLSMVASLYQAQLETPLLEIVESRCPSKLKNPKASWDPKIISVQKEIPLSERADPSTFK